MAGRGEGRYVFGRQIAGRPYAYLLLVIAATAGCSASAGPPLDRARTEWRNENFPAAAQAYEDFLSTNPTGEDAADAQFTLADVYYHNLKQFDRAKVHYAAYLASFPTGERAYEARERLAEVNVELKDLPEAIVQYERLLEEHPNPPTWRKIRSTIADLYYRLEDFNQAEVEYTKVVENTSYDEFTEQALLRLASIAHKVKHRSADALPMYERVATTSLDPTVQRAALKSKSEVYADLFRFDEAETTLRRIDDPSEAEYIETRIAELERQRAQHADAPEVDWSKGTGEGG